MVFTVFSVQATSWCHVFFFQIGAYNTLGVIQKLSIFPPADLFDLPRYSLWTTPVSGPIK